MTIHIESASYLKLDVTKQIQALADSGRRWVMSSNDIAGDPAVGVKKTLTVTYSIDGVRYTKQAIEGDALLFYSMNGGKLAIYYTNNHIHPHILNGTLEQAKRCGVDLVTCSWAPLPGVINLPAKYRQSS